jgi:hypothetical protein
MEEKFVDIKEEEKQTMQYPKDKKPYKRPIVSLIVGDRRKTNIAAENQISKTLISTCKITIAIPYISGAETGYPFGIRSLIRSSNCLSSTSTCCHPCLLLILHEHLLSPVFAHRFIFLFCVFCCCFICPRSESYMPNVVVNVDCPLCCSLLIVLFTT